MYWGVQMVGATVVKGGVPVIQLTFMCQHVHCVKNKDGKIVEGSEVLNCAVHPDWMVWLYAHAHVIIAASIRPPCTPSSTIGCCSVTWSHRTLTGRSWNGPLSECMRCNDDASDVRYHLQLQRGAALSMAMQPPVFQIVLHIASHPLLLLQTKQYNRNNQHKHQSI